MTKVLAVLGLLLAFNASAKDCLVQATAAFKHEFPNDSLVSVKNMGTLAPKEKSQHFMNIRNVNPFAVQHFEVRSVYMGKRTSIVFMYPQTCELVDIYEDDFSGMD